MRNTSDPIKENSHVMNAQGGEKKVMKKILSVALSTAMAFSMFASVAFGDTAVTPQQQFDALKAKGIFNGYPDGTAGLDKEMTRAEFAKVITKLLGLKEITGVYSYNDKNYNAKNWAAPYIEAVTAAGIMEGKNVEKKIFDFNGKVTIAEMATILTRALDLEIPTETNNNAAAWAKGYVQAAINAGLIDANANFGANASRELLVGAAYSIDQAQSLKVESYTVSEAGKVVEFKISDGETVKVTLDKALEANKETEVKFTYKDKEFSEKVTYVVTAATKIEGATASNYKELVVKFDGEVDATTAENTANYTVSGRTFESATLSADKKSVTLLVEENTGNLPQQRDTNLVVKGVKNATATKTFDETVKFTAVDTQLPEVKSVQGLGTKALRVEFSEPVTSATAGNLANYKVNGQAISGFVKYTYPNIAFITTDLPVGEHTLTVSGVKDFAGFSASTAESKFTIAEDTTAPEITKITTNDLKKVVVEFNEPVKSVSSAYQTSSNKSATVSIKDNVVTLTFSDPNRLSLGESTVYLNGVTDYSNNSADRNAKVTPELDTIRPTVSGVTSKTVDGKTELTVEFSEKISTEDYNKVDNYVLKDSAGKIYTGKGFTTKGNPSVAPRYAVDKNSKNDETKVVLTSVGGTLPAGNYTLEVSGVRDQAAIGNTIIPQSVPFTLTQTGALETTAAWYNNDEANNEYQVYVQFNRPVATSGNGNALDVNKYDYVVTNATYKPFPASSTTVQLYNANTVLLTVSKEDVKDLQTASALRVVNVADTNGNFVDGTTVSFGSQTTSNVEVVTNSVYAKAQNKVEVKFKGELTFVNKSDFKFTGLSEESDFNITNQSVVDGNTVVEFTFAKDKAIAYNSGVTLTTETQDKIASADSVGRKLKAFSATVLDGIKPVFDKDADNAILASDTTVTLKFTENVKSNFTPAAYNVTVDGTKVNVTRAEANNKVLTLTLEKAVNAGQLVEVELVNNSTGSFVTDTNNNPAENFYASVKATN
ncbi:S-layer homology domain-containing protein [Paenibacillus illinoisensis]|uniref:S-layer domain protein n=1 Tax=Paenibacillus illinoisensis TaxID=59845 RepID=A0A2W0D0W6_9BACL|nr:S-layer homology domain-containing protein [Paenibacillus illinoisensis]PYY29551.1 S-layer domain protein [Paenibacillus illinoisensis]